MRLYIDFLVQSKLEKPFKNFHIDWMVWLFMFRCPTEKHGLEIGQCYDVITLKRWALESIPQKFPFFHTLSYKYTMYVIILMWGLIITKAAVNTNRPSHLGKARRPTHLPSKAITTSMWTMIAKPIKEPSQTVVEQMQMG